MTAIEKDCWLCRADKATVVKPKMRYSTGKDVVVCKDCSDLIDSNPSQNDRTAWLRVKRCCRKCDKAYFPKHGMSLWCEDCGPKKACGKCGAGEGLCDPCLIVFDKSLYP